MEMLHNEIVSIGGLQGLGPSDIDLDTNLDLEISKNHTYNIRVFGRQRQFELELQLHVINEHFRRETILGMV
jgi:hypothetical protein